MPLDTFFKLTAEDPEAKCNVITPLNPHDLEREINPRTGRVITQNDKTAAKQAFQRIANARGAMVGVCCDPSSNYQKHDKQILDDLRTKYPSVRLIKNNAGEVTEIELSRVKKPVVKGWRQISPYLVCKIINATLSDDPNDTDIVRATNLTKDCYTENCDPVNGLTLESLFGSMPAAEIEYTTYDDAQVERAVNDGDVTYVQNYLRKYNNVNQVLTHNNYRNRILHLAVRAGYEQEKHKKMLDLVLAVRPNLNVRDHAGNTSLHIAAAHGQLEALDRLLQYGGSTNSGINARNNRGETPIMLAVGYNSPKQDLDTIDGRTPSKFFAMTRLLYNNGANIMDVDNNGNNILHHVILNSPPVADKSRLVRYLIERGANTEQANNEGITPLAMVGDLLGDYKDIEYPPELTDEEKEASKWITHELSNNKEGFNTVRANSNFSNVKFNTTEQEVTAAKDPNTRELLAIQTLLFNTHIRQHPEKYSKPVNVSMIPRGAPLVVRHYMCSADGSTDNPSMALHDLDTRTECEASGGQWVKISKPSTMVQVKLIEEGETNVDAVPEDSLYYPKTQPSKVYMPLPDEIQKLNAEVRKQESSNNNGTLASNKNGTLSGREGFEDITGEYVSRGPIPGLLNNTNNVKANNSENLVAIEHPEVCRGYKVIAESENARLRTKAVLANNFRDSAGIQRIGQFTKDNYVLILVLLLLILLCLWQLAKCMC